MANIESSNLKVHVGALLTSNTIHSSSLRIVVSGAKSIDTGVLFSPNTKNTPRSIKLTKSWHIIDIEHALSILSDDTDCKYFTKRSPTVSLINDLNTCEYMFTGKPGKFKAFLNTIEHHGNEVCVIMGEHNIIAGVFILDDNIVVSHMVTSLAVLRYADTMFTNVITNKYYKGYK